MSAARNLGIRHARGELVAFLDADDVWRPPALEKLIVLLDAFPGAGMAYSPLMFWFSWTGKHHDRDRDFVYPLGVPPKTLVHPPTLLTRHLRNEASFPVPSALIIRREVVVRIDGFEESFRGLYEDQVFCAKVALATPVVATYTHWYGYRQHPDSCCNVALRSGANYAARGVYLNWLEQYLQQQGVADAQVSRALARELWWYRNPRVHQWLTRFPRAYLWCRKIERAPRWLRRHLRRTTWRTAFARVRYDAWQHGQILAHLGARMWRRFEPKRNNDSARPSTLESNARERHI